MLFRIITFFSFSYLIVSWACADDAAALRTLPYAQWAEKNENSHFKGVTHFEEERASIGRNLYTDNTDTVLLLDMHGEVIRSWKVPNARFCEHAVLLPNDEVLVECVQQGIAKLDKDSNRLWQYKALVTHEIALTGSGTIIVPVQKTIVYRGRSVIFDELHEITSAGKFLRKWSSFDHLVALKKMHGPTDLDVPPKIATKEIADYYHLNAVQELPENKSGKKDARFSKGNLLVSLPIVNLIVIVDRKSGQPVWSWGQKILDFQHGPTMLPSGEIIVFDNGTKRGQSRVIKLDPLTGKMLWQYGEADGQDFYSQYRGYAQQLSNGNLLITSSEDGYVFEITSDGSKVWEFWNPITKKGRRKRIYRMWRYPL